ncbi:hypothetical protein LV457_17600 [Mycobacterium sp. MYCO198283]|uniref:hypothetical protein n=1 Tax=Mycobacterium sp. MYCO198283 TaxID=2883505 RepID=UPI001E53194C|nr:hypothetical protein [Mycobacterium sp. MYCO198283]MCG5434090.1 hypothetical protein [Mycobacterium sp. MYCO198283]
MNQPTQDGDHSADDLTKYAFDMEPQVEPGGDTWTAFYPGADWSVSAPSREQALHELRKEFIRRQNAGQDPLAYADAVYRAHLREPIAGVYAVDNELYRELVHAPESNRRRAVQEAERRRRLGQTYTKSDYLKDCEESAEQTPEPGPD